MISLKQLRYLDAVARFGHFGKAAAHCGISQPALSMQIQELEAALGLCLVERRSRGASLTAPGLEIAARAARVLAEVRDISDVALAFSGLLAAPIRFGAIPTVAPYVLPPLLSLIRTRHPSLELRVRETHTDQLLVELADGRLDVLLLALPLANPDLATLALREDRFLLAVPPGHTIRGPVRATPELIRNDRLLLLEEGHCLRDQALAVCGLRRAEAIDTFGATNLTTIVQLVASGLGLTFLPEISLGLECRHADIRVIRFDEPEPTRTLGLAWRASSPRSADFEALGELVREALPAPLDPARPFP